MSADSYLTEGQVRARLHGCAQDDVVNDLYSFGQKLADQALELVRSTEHKATFFAAYGSAAVTLLASSFSKWADLGNRHTLWIALCASACAFLCTLFAVRVLCLKQIECISEAEWIHESCLDEPMALKKYRIFTLWGSIDSRFRGQESKAKDLRRAEVALAFSGLFLLYLLVHLVILQTIETRIERHMWDACWQFFIFRLDFGDLFTLLILGGTSVGFCLFMWRVRLLRFFRHNIEPAFRDSKL